MKQNNNPLLCPICKTGQDTYLLDNRNPFCPYVHCHNGVRCTAYIPSKKYNGGKEIDSGNHN